MSRSFAALRFDRRRGSARADPCFGCVQSALAGYSNGACHNNSSSRGGGRCWRCDRTRLCQACPGNVLPAARRLISALQSNPSHSIRALRRLREKVRIQMAIAATASGAGGEVGETAAVQGRSNCQVVIEARNHEEVVMSGGLGAPGFGPAIAADPATPAGVIASPPAEDLAARRQRIIGLLGELIDLIIR